jgi:hypothetical protein
MKKNNQMKKIFITFNLIFFIQVLYAQADRNTVRDLMRFYYVEQINNATYTPVLLDNAAIMTGTETGVFWTTAAMSGPQNLVRALLKPSNSGGDGNMQRIAAKILRVLNKPVRVNLLNDASTNVGTVARNRYGACVGDNNKAWPCASNMTISDDRAADCARILGVAAPARTDNVWAGTVCMGTAYFSASGAMSFKFSTILHELVHTQDYTDGRGHLFWVGTRNYRYGADGSHFGTEAIPNRAMTYKEGIANAIRLMYDNGRLNEMFTWFASNGNLLVERAIHPPGSTPSDSLHRCILAMAPSPDVWLYNQLTTAGITPLGQTPDGLYGMFRLRSLPARFIAHNEYILALIGEEYTRHVGENKFFNAIRAVNSQGLRTSSSGYAMLFKSLCDQAIPAGTTFASLQTSSPASVPKPYLYALALLDYFTGYRANTEADFRAILEDQSYMNDWIQLYFANGKDVVRNAVPLTSPRRENLTDIAIALGINSSSPD